jgi:hypothetical protein
MTSLFSDARRTGRFALRWIFGQGVSIWGADLEDVAFRIDCVARFPGLLPRTPQHLNSERFQACPLPFYVFHFEDELHGFFFSRGRLSTVKQVAQWAIEPHR